MAINLRAVKTLGSNFDPRKIPGLVGWYDSADLTSMAENDDGTGSVSIGSTVGYWKDKSGSNNHVTQSTADNRPTVTASAVNDKTALVFDGSNDTLERSNYTDQSGLTGLTRIALYSTSQNAQFSRDLSGADTPFLVSSNTLVSRVAGSNGIAVSIPTTNSLTLGIYSSVFDGSDQTMKINFLGATLPTTTSPFVPSPPSSTTGAGPGTLAIGSNNGANQFVDGPIAEYLVYNRTLNDYELRYVEEYLAKKWGFTLAPKVSNAEAQDYINRIYAAGSSIDTTAANAINDFVTGCQNDGIWDSIKACCILCGANSLAGALVPLVGATPTNNNFVSSDYDRLTGLKGDGNTKSLDSNRANNADPQDDNHNAIYHSANAGVGGFQLTAGNAATGSNAILRSTGTLQVRNRTAAGTNSAFGTTLGFKGISRSASADYTYRVGSTDYTASSVSQTPFNGNVILFSDGNTGYGSDRLAFYSIGESLDLALLDNRVSALITAIQNSV